MSSKPTPIIPLLSLSALVVIVSAGLVIVQQETPHPTAQAAAQAAPVSPYLGTFKSSSSTKPQQIEVKSDGTVVVTTWVIQRPLVQTGYWHETSTDLTLDLSTESVTLIRQGSGLKTTKYSALFGSAGIVLSPVN